jgi:hypothetical protein
MLVVQAAQQPPIGPTDNVVICADSANVLHARAARAGCAARETPLPAQATHSPPTPSTDGLDLDNWRVDSENDRPKGNTLADLEARVARLKLDLAYFTVVDRDGSKIFEVMSDAATVYSHDSHVSVAAMSTASDNGGILAARSGDGSHVMKFGGVGSKVGVQISWDGVPRLQLGRFDSGTFSLKVWTPGGGGGQTIAGIGESRAGTGALVISTRAGRPRASMMVDQGRGQVNIFDDTGASVASIREAESGDGLLSLGKTVEFVKMVVNGAYGAVLAGPVLGFPHVPASGIPGSYLLGCAGGPACHPT